MEAYTDFAQVYDTFMDNAPYEEWADFIMERLRSAGIRDGLVLDLGCGTGAMTELLAGQGYDMIGVDLSGEMLNVAMEKQERRRREQEAETAAGQEREAFAGQDGGAEDKRRILYLQQDMREFELYGTVRAAVCVCDSLNYLMEEEDIRETFRLVNNYLDPGGMFLFDFNTVYKYETVIGDATIAENREECSFIWENYYNEEEQINEYDVTVFVQTEKGLFRRFTETHFQKGYTLPVIRRLVEESGLAFVEALDADTLGEVTEQSERICCIAKEQGK